MVETEPFIAGCRSELKLSDLSTWKRTSLVQEEPASPFPHAFYQINQQLAPKMPFAEQSTFL